MAGEVRVVRPTDSLNAAVAVEAGASYLGVVFANGPRRASPFGARNGVARRLPRPGRRGEREVAEAAALQGGTV